MIYFCFVFFFFFFYWCNKFLLVFFVCLCFCCFFSTLLKSFLDFFQNVHSPNELTGASIIMNWIALSGYLEKKLNARSSHRVFFYLAFTEEFSIDFRKWSKTESYDFKRIFMCLFLCLMLIPCTNLKSFIFNCNAIKLNVCNFPLMNLENPWDQNLCVKILG